MSGMALKVDASPAEKTKEVKQWSPYVINGG